MCVLLVSFGSNVRPKTFECVAMCSVVLFILKSRLLVYSAGSPVNRVQVVLSRFSVRLFCFVQIQTVCRYDCLFIFCTRVCVCIYDGDVICVGHDMNRCSGCW